MTKYPQPVVEGVAGTVPLQRLGTEEEFAWLVAYLASPAGDYFSGAVLTLDGARDNWFGAWPPGGHGRRGRPAAPGGAQGSERCARARDGAARHARLPRRRSGAVGRHPRRRRGDALARARAAASPPDEAWREMAMLAGHWALKGFGHWALEERSSGALIGNAGLFFPPDWPALEVGWTVARPRWGEGFAGEAARAAAGWAQAELGAGHLISLIAPVERALAPRRREARHDPRGRGPRARLRSARNTEAISRLPAAIRAHAARVPAAHEREREQRAARREVRRARGGARRRGGRVDRWRAPGLRHGRGAPAPSRSPARARRRASSRPRQELIEAASHGENRHNPAEDAFTPEVESDESGAAYGEPDELDTDRGPARTPARARTTRRRAQRSRPAAGGPRLSARTASTAPPRSRSW